MGRIEREELIRCLEVKSSHPFLFEKLFHPCFPTTLLIEAGCSAANNALTKIRNLLQIEKRGYLCLKPNQDSEDQLEKLTDDTRSSVVISQDFYFQLHFAFVNKIHFLLQGFFICTYVGLKFF